MSRRISVGYLRKLAAAALAEDVGKGDVTSNLVIPADKTATAQIVQKTAGVAFGYQIAEAVFKEVDSSIGWQELKGEGVWRSPRAALVEVSGSARSLLTAERVAVNFLQHLSGIATLTARFVQEVEGTDTAILDTRKTLPGLRTLEKEAVRAGGGHNHRFGLDDGVLVKDNHIAVVGSLKKAVADAVSSAPPGMFIEVECSNYADVEQALEAGAPRILLDNMYPDELQKAAELVAGRAELEASGGVTLETVREIATTAVQYISVGSLTHSAPALDLSLEMGD